MFSLPFMMTVNVMIERIWVFLCISRRNYVGCMMPVNVMVSVLLCVGVVSVDLS